MAPDAELEEIETEWDHLVLDTFAFDLSHAWKSESVEPVRISVVILSFMYCQLISYMGGSCEFTLTSSWCILDPAMATMLPAGIVVPLEKVKSLRILRSIPTDILWETPWEERSKKKMAPAWAVFLCDSLIKLSSFRIFPSEALLNPSSLMTCWISSRSSGTWDGYAARS